MPADLTPKESDIYQSRLRKYYHDNLATYLTEFLPVDDIHFANLGLADLASIRSDLKVWFWVGFVRPGLSQYLIKTFMGKFIAERRNRPLLKHCIGQEPRFAQKRAAEDVPYVFRYMEIDTEEKWQTAFRRDCVYTTYGDEEITQFIKEHFATFGRIWAFL